MQNTIPAMPIVMMAISALIGIAIPVVLYIIFRKKGANHLPFWTGCVTFVLFALVLEQLAYSFLMKTALWITVANNVWFYGIVGGFMAGLFEETGRFVAFKTVLRKQRGNDTNALMYGAGHGGIEAVALLSVSMIINVIFCLQYNAGVPSSLGGSAEALAIAAAPSALFLAGGVERMLAVTIHVSLSVLVWFAAKDGKKFWLYPLAILLHLVVDAVAVILKGVGMGNWLIEGAVFVITLGLVFIAIAVWKKNHVAQAPEAIEESAVPEAQA
ncbi:MAG: YhfC family glutamic-type intramembrane protease [Eubacteriales bacterium]|nr:YhfC family glutamic-type intramembrane protease [Eubacteriales bacterium]